MKKGTIFLAIFISLVGIIVAIGLMKAFDGRIENNNDKRMGNTPGNLMNGGTFCEYEGRVYFANPADKGTIYSMRPDGSDLKKIGNDTASYINIGGNSIIYVRKNDPYDNAVISYKNRFGICRTDLNGNNYVAYNDYVMKSLVMVGNDLYYRASDDKKSYKLFLNNIRGNSEELIGEATFSMSTVKDNKIYYINQGDMNSIYVYNVKNQLSESVLKKNAYMLLHEEDYLYYIDISKGYSLYKYDIKQKRTEILIDADTYGKCVKYNVYEDKLFVLTETEGNTLATLYRYDMKANKMEFVAKVNISDIQCTSEYTYYTVLGTNEVYRVKTDGEIEPKKMNLYVN
ncbi:MAG: DUF5050 domain-containing protein [Lachnospiraceae bacterium]|nr:DUF5050 domain-containing protein [Lachnospiraceae bacterium]